MADTNQPKKKRILKLRINEISLVKSPAIEEEFLILKSMDADPDLTDIQKAAVAHEQLMNEKLEALWKIAVQLKDGAATMSADDVNAKLNQLNDLSYAVRESVNIVNIAKTGGAEMTDKATESVQLDAIKDLVTKAQAKIDEIEKAKTDAAAAAAAAVAAGDVDAIAKAKKAKADADAAAADGKDKPKFPDMAKVKKLVSSLQKLLGGEEVKKTDDDPDAAGDGGDDDPVNKGVKQLSKERQGVLKETLKGIGTLLKEVDPDFDMSKILEPDPEPTDVEKAIVSMKDDILKGLTDKLAPIQKQVDELKNTAGSSRSEDPDGGGAGDGDDPLKKSALKPGDPGFWGGIIKGKSMSEAAMEDSD